MSWSSLSPRERARVSAIVLERDGRRCQIRKPNICTVVATTVDHIVDRDVAGDGPDNLRAACGPCNFSRGEPGREDPEPRAGGWTSVPAGAAATDAGDPEPRSGGWV